jgi:hypothetical protein
MRELSTQQLKEHKARVIKKLAAYQTKLAEVQHRLEWLDNYLLPVWVDGVEMSQQDAAELLSPGVYLKQDRQRLVAIAMRPHEDTWITLGTHHVVSNRPSAPHHNAFRAGFVSEMHKQHHQLTAKALMGMTVVQEQRVRIVNKYTNDKGSRVVSCDAAITEVHLYAGGIRRTVRWDIYRVLNGEIDSCHWRSTIAGHDIEVRRL